MPWSIDFRLEWIGADKEPGPRGELLMERLRNKLAEFDWLPSELEIFHGCWAFSCVKEGSRLLVSLGEMTDNSMFVLQIGPAQAPGLFLWLSGKKPSASREWVIALANDAYRTLKSTPYVQLLGWGWDGKFSRNEWPYGVQ